MYKSFFRLEEKPFNLTPDPRYLYLNHNHREVLASLKYGIREKRGFIVITGEVGTGKTTHLFNFLEKLGEKTVSAFIFNPILTQQEFFQYIFEDFNLPSGLKTKTEFLVGLNNFLLEQAEKGVTVVLVIDEAQNLSNEILEEIRLLSNLETSREKLLQIVLVGQPELDEKLQSSTLRQLKQRISIRGQILPLGVEETGDYIHHRLKVAGYSGEEEIFDQELMALIARLSSGIPRVVNNICDNVLLSCYAVGRRVADRGLVLEVAEDLDLDTRADGDLQPGTAMRSEMIDIGLRVLEDRDSPLVKEVATPEHPSFSNGLLVGGDEGGDMMIDGRSEEDAGESEATVSVAAQFHEKAGHIESGSLPINGRERSIPLLKRFIERLKLEND